MSLFHLRIGSDNDDFSFFHDLAYVLTQAYTHMSLLELAHVASVGRVNSSVIHYPFGHNKNNG